MTYIWCLILISWVILSLWMSFNQNQGIIMKYTLLGVANRFQWDALFSCFSASAMSLKWKEKRDRWQLCTNILILSATLCHELIGYGLQQLRLILLGADKMSLSGRSRLQRTERDTKKLHSKQISEEQHQHKWLCGSSFFLCAPSYLALELHPGAVLLGLQLLGVVVSDTLQEAGATHWVLHMLNAHVDLLGQDLAPGAKITQNPKVWKGGGSLSLSPGQLKLSRPTSQVFKHLP